MPRGPHRKPASVGQRIRARRLELGFTQRDIATENVTSAYISRIESGERHPSYEALVELSVPLTTSALWLLTGSEDGYCPVCDRG